MIVLLVILLSPLALVFGLLLVRLVFTPAGFAVLGCILAIVVAVPVIFVVSTIVNAR
jgi:hypothetical protein